jgi:hypothetical protein
MSDHDHTQHHHHGTETARPRRILGIRFSKKPKPPKTGIAGPDGLSGGGTPVGCCGSCLGDKPVRLRSRNYPETIMSR